MERKLIAAAVSSALALPMAAHAVEGSVSGHVNRAIIHVDGTGADNDGDLQHVDSNASETRFRFTGSEDLGNGMEAGVQLELGRPSNWRTRHANVHLSGGFGKLTIGQASAATDGMAHADLGGASWLGGVSNWCSYASSGPACPSNDGNRMQVLRYDTPSIGPASIAVSISDNDYWDVMATFAGSFGDAGYNIRIGHIAEYETPAPVAATPASIDNVRGSDLPLVNPVNQGDDPTLDGDGLDDGQVVGGIDGTPLAPGAPVDSDGFYHLFTPMQAGNPNAVDVKGDVTTVSAAFGFGQGTSVALAWSQEDTGDQVEYQYFKLDHSYGDGSVGVYYKTGEYGAGANAGVEGTLWGVGIGHGLGGGATAYAGYRQIEEDGKEDVDLMLAGMRVTFN